MSALNRRQTRRHALPEEFEGRVEFGYPAPEEHRCSMALNDISESGLSFVLEHELPGLEVGRQIEQVTLHAGGRVIDGDMVITHLTSEAGGSVCGALFYPSSDADLIHLRELLAELGASGSGAARTA